VNVQGDEPLVNPADILAIVEEKRKYPDCVINGYCPIASDEHVDSVNLPKVVFTEDRRLVYMSRSRIPGSKSEAGWPEAFHKQVCIYGYDRNELRLYTSVGRKSTLERIEDIEILRFLDLGKTVRMIETSSGTLSVDVPQDVGPVEKALKAMMGRN
jgi:3-deoxy-manno-octulosonate cytidylyltransferase (CMP-KDO synthetase)